MREEMKPNMQEAESSFVSMLSGWMQQGVENFFATQRILVDLAMRQNAAAIQLVRERLADSRFSPVAILSELAGEGMSNFIAGQKVLLDLVHQENEIVLNGVKHRVGGSDAAVAMADLMRRSLNMYIEMQQDFLKVASKQTHGWLTAIEKGKAYDGEQFIELAREGMEHFVQAQQKFLNLIAEEADKAISTRTEAGKKMKVEELSEIAGQATECFIEAQKKLMDVAGKQMNANVKASGRALEMLKPLAEMPLPELARDGVKSFVDAEKALLDTMTKRPPMHHKVVARKGRTTKRTARTIKPDVVHA